MLYAEQKVAQVCNVIVWPAVVIVESTLAVVMSDPVEY
jgi:hypothetical protein